MALIVLMGLFNVSLFANVPLVTFEAPLRVGESIEGLEGWKVLSGRGVVEAGVGDGGSQGLRVGAEGGGESHVVRAIPWDEAQKTAFVDMKILPPANDAGSGAVVVVGGAQVAFQKSVVDRTKGELWVLDGSEGWSAGQGAAGLRRAQWVLTGASFDLRDGGDAARDYLRLTLRQDREAGVWDVFVNGRMVAVNLHFEDGGRGPRELHLYGSGAVGLQVDEVQVSGTNPLFQDTDGDGMADVEERAMGSDPLVRDRERVDPASGMSYLDKYLAGMRGNGQRVGSGVSGMVAGSGGAGEIPPLGLPVHEAVGSLKGEFSVGADGTGTYGVPLDLPKGTSGMEPQLSIGYSSQGGTGTCGLGFELGGLQSITRGGSSLRKDGEIDGIDFDEKDRFFLNGMRLVCVAGEYGRSGSEYRTEIDSFLRVRLYGDANVGYESFWRVETKAGLVYEFGGTGGSRLCGLAAPAPLGWAMNRVTDLCGNYYEVQYAVGATDEVVGLGAGKVAETTQSHRVARILYTGNRDLGLVPYVSVDFRYEDRPDGSLGYLAGVKMEGVKRLKEIAVRTDGQLHHRYELTYRKSLQTGRSLLVALTKRMAAGGAHTTTFGWDAYLEGEMESLPPMWSSAGTEPLLKVYESGKNERRDVISHVSIEEGGRTVHLTGAAWRYYELPKAYEVTSQTMLSLEFRRPKNPESDVIAVGLDTDLQGDSKHVFQLAGKVKSGYDRSTYSHWVASAGGLVVNGAPDDEWVKVLIPIGSRVSGLHRNLVFINDDGSAEDGVGECWFRAVTLFESSATRFEEIRFPTRNWELPSWFSSSWEDRGLMFAEVNGDGLADVVRHDVVAGNDWRDLKTVSETYLNTGEGWVTAGDEYLVPGMMSAHDGDGTDAALTYMRALASLVDYNADGRPDLMKRVVTDGARPDVAVVSFEAMMHDGKGWKERADARYPFTTHREGTSDPASTDRFRDWVEVDVNGDGLVDLLRDLQVVKKSAVGMSVVYLQNEEGLGKERWTLDMNYALPDGGMMGNGCIRNGLLEPDLGRGLVDLNGDGLPDLYAAGPYPDRKGVQPPGGEKIYQKSFLHTGKGWSKEVVNARLPVLLVDENDDAQGVRLIDLNGDGLVDVVRAYGQYVNESKPPEMRGMECYLNRGSVEGGSLFVRQGEAKWVTAHPQDMKKSSKSLAYGNEWVDVNGDGLSDLVFGVRSGTVVVKEAYLNTGEGLVSAEAYRLPDGVLLADGVTAMEKGRRSAMFADVNGDGGVDILAKLNEGSPQIWLNQSRSEKLVRMVDGFESEIVVEYARLNDPKVRAEWGSRVYEPYRGELGGGEMAVCDGRLVVARYSLPDGIRGRRGTSYRYGDLRYDRWNECSGGFAWMEVMDELSRQVTRTEYCQKYPFVGSPLRSWTKVWIGKEDLSAAAAANSDLYEGTEPGWKKLTEEFSRYDKKAALVGVGGRIERPFQVWAEQRHYDLRSRDPEVPDLKSRTVTEQALDDFDEYGFLKRSRVVSLDGGVVETRNEYRHLVDGGRWCPGRLMMAEVTHSRPGGESVLRRSAFKYRENGMLEEELVEPGDELSTSKVYGYDGFGNVTGVAVKGSGQVRWQKSLYDERGRFVVKEVLPLGHEVKHVYDPVRALRVSTTDVDGLTTRYEYDAFGTQVLTRHPDGTLTGEVTGRVKDPGDLGLPGWDLGGICYFRAKQHSGEPMVRVYFDVVGREILTRTTQLADAGADGAARYREVYIHRVYDARGRETGVSHPFGRGEQVFYTRNHLDTFSRAYLTVHPNGAKDQVYVYGVRTLDGQPMTYSSATSVNHQVLERWEDQHGRLVRSRDASGMVTEFEHDVLGHLVRVKVGGELLLENTFDRMGNKVAVWEANSGRSRTVYNAYGEVVESVNARGQVTRYRYDELGRVIEIARPEGTYVQEYDLSGGSAAKGKPVRVRGPEGYEERWVYDGWGRVVATSRTQAGETWVTSTSYDALGRVVLATDAGGLTTRTIYDERYSFPVKVVLAGVVAGSGTTLWAAGRFDSQGQVVSQELAHGVKVERRYEAETGNLLGLKALRNQVVLQDRSYEWDVAGNLSRRVNDLAKPGSKALDEAFIYDGLNRLAYRLVGGRAQTFTYDVRGNLLSKPGAVLRYENGKPHQVSEAVVKGKARRYYYDVSGYVVDDGVRTYGWTSFGQLSSLVHAGAPELRDLGGRRLFDGGMVATRFIFDASGSRALQWKMRTSAVSGQCDEELTTYVGSYEREVHRSAGSQAEAPVWQKTVHRHRIGEVVYTRVESIGGGTQYRLSTRLDDHLGSTDVLVTGIWSGQGRGFGEVSVEYQAYDPWGERAEVATGEALRKGHGDPQWRSGEEEDRGYTGHEMLDDSGLVHMNGRIYDPELGRMLSADPHVQVPEYSQNFNRYSYVLNNPLNKVDPTGYLWISKLFHKFGSWISESWKQLVVIVVGVVLTFTGAGAFLAGGVLGAVGGQATGFALQMATGAVVGGIMGTTQAFLSGGSWGDVLKGAVVGAVQGAISSGPLHQMASAGSINGRLAHVVGHGATGGLANVAMGGKFEDGFLSAASGAAAVHLGLERLQSKEGGEALGVAGRTAVAAVVGGTAAELGGGKFANGAYTAAFQHLLNAEGGKTSDKANNSSQNRSSLSKDLNKGVEILARSPLGYIWNLPNTAIGLTLGAVGFIGEVLTLPFTLKWDFSIQFSHNSIGFVNHPLFMKGGALTIGNVINYGRGASPEENGAYGDYSVNIGRHEEAHTYQGQLLGPFYLPTFLATGVATLENPFEQAAQSYGKGGSEWWPR